MFYVLSVKESLMIIYLLDLFVGFHRTKNLNHQWDSGTSKKRILPESLSLKLPSHLPLPCTDPQRDTWALVRRIG